MKRLLGGLLFLAATSAFAQVHLEEYPSFEIPITPFANMASGYQATNPGFRAILRSEGGDFIAGGFMDMDAVIKGRKDDASHGSAYGRLILNLDMKAAYPGVTSGVMSGTYRGKLSICMAEDVNAPLEQTRCKSLSGNIHPERPFQWLDKACEFVVTEGNIRITKFSGNTGDGGTSEQLSLAVYHPAYAFAAPGKAFKDFQSPLVLDLKGNGLDLVDVWMDKPVLVDLNNTGKKVRTGWVKPQDGILVWDYDHTGVVNGSKLLGEYTKTTKGEKTFENGFQALSLLDANSDGTVAAAELKDLYVWQDLNQNGEAEKGEVKPAATFVQSISLAYESVPEKEQMKADNEVRLTSSYKAADGKTRTIGDVWFKQRRYSDTTASN